MTDRTSVDIDGLKAGGVDLEAIAQQAQEIARDLINACREYAHAGGTDTMGRQFDLNYKPNEEIGMQFLHLLNDIIGRSGVRTSKTAHAFADTESEANEVAGRG
jgi:hypothetical protein